MSDFDDLTKDEHEESPKPKKKVEVIVRNDDADDVGDAYNDLEDKEDEPQHKHIEVETTRKRTKKQPSFVVKGLVGVLVVAGIFTTIHFLHGKKGESKTDNSALAVPAEKPASAPQQAKADDTQESANEMQSALPPAPTQAGSGVTMVPDQNGDVLLANGKKVNISSVDTSNGPKMLLPDGTITNFDPLKLQQGGIIIGAPKDSNALINPDVIAEVKSRGQNPETGLPNQVALGSNGELPQNMPMPAAKSGSNASKAMEASPAMLAQQLGQQAALKPAFGTATSDTQQTMSVLALAARQEKMERELNDIKQKLAEIESMLNGKASAYQSASAHHVTVHHKPKHTDVAKRDKGLDITSILDANKRRDKISVTQHPTPAKVVADTKAIYIPAPPSPTMDSAKAPEVHKVSCRYLGGLDNRAWVSCDEKISSVREGDELPAPYGRVTKVDAQNGDIETSGGTVR